MIFNPRKIILFFGFLLFWLKSQGQTSCGLSNDNIQQRNFLLQEFLNQNSKKARKGTTYVIYVNPKIIHKNTGSQIFNENQVYELITKLNTVFAPINVLFKIEENNIKHIYDDNLFDLKVNSESELRKKWDSENGINLYFAHTITKPDLSLLNGYTSLPNLANSSNAIILSYLDNSPETFNLLKNKIIAHEFGHYFGLYHTYHDSNESDISKRELVTRGIGSNCTNAGDQLCDTPADPYERNPSIFSLSCNEKLPGNIIDSNGDLFSPPVDNYMSYQIKCGFNFTPMQYQKIEAGLNIRLSPNAEYSLTRNVSNFLSVNNFNKNSFCQNEEVIVNYQINGTFDPKNKISLEISDKNGQNFKEMPNFEILSENKLKFFLGSNFENGNNYRLIIKTSLPYIESPLSSSFEIKSLPTAQLNVSESRINQGDEIQIMAKFGGSGPWSFRDWDGLFYENITSSSISFNVAPKYNSDYILTQISNKCGVLNQTPSLNVEVFQPSIQVESKEAFCNSSLIELNTLGIRYPDISDYYQIQITGAPNKIYVFPTISNNKIRFYFPQNLEIGKTYSLKIIGKKLGEFSRSVPFVVKTPPEQPKISSPLNICNGATDVFLKADGTNLKWYKSELDTTFTYSVLLNTSQAGNLVYFVSQSDDTKCESKKSKLEVNVSEPVSAQITGQSTIFLGDSTTVKISLKGAPPWKFSLEDNNEYNVSSNEFYLFMKPFKSTIYKLQSVSNYCGQGTVSGQADINVISILSKEPNKQLKVFPNPSFNQSVEIENTASFITNVQLYTTDGKLIEDIKIDKKNRFRYETDSLESGKYILKIVCEEKTFTRPIQILK